VADKLETNADAIKALLRPEVTSLSRYRLVRHENVTKLDQNENSFGPPEPVQRALLESGHNVPFHRYPDLEATELRKALGELCDWPHEGILVGNGSNELLLMLALSTLEKGRTAIAPSPSFSTYGFVARLMGADVVEVPAEENLAHKGERFEAAIEKHRPVLVFLCTPNNPTGIAMSPSEVLAVANSFRGLLVVDEAYWEFSGWSAREILPSHPNVVVLRTFSKAAGLAGLRMGYLIAHPELAQEIQKTQLPYAVNEISRRGALAACNHYDAIRARALEIIEERERLYKHMEALGGIQPYPSQTNFILFECAAGANPVFDGLVTRGVLVRNLSAHPRLGRCLRVTVGRREENDEFLEALSGTLEELT
jgi:histidinol-phosphate aminotransferase